MGAQRGGATVCPSSFESANHSEGRTSAGAYLAPPPQREGEGEREREKEDERRAGAYEICGNKHRTTSVHENAIERYCIQSCSSGKFAYTGHIGVI